MLCIGPEILETMRALLEAMADPNFQCNAGSTPLDYAVYWAGNSGDHACIARSNGRPKFSM